MSASKPVAFVSLFVLAMLVGCHTTPFASYPLEVSATDIEQQDVPAPALKTLQNAAGGRPITAFEREDRGLYIAYEGEWQEGDIEAEITVLPDGGLLESESELAKHEFALLPPAIRRRVEALQQRGYRVEIAKQAIYFYEIEAERENEGSEDSEQEWLLRPDGSDATRPPAAR